MKREEGDFSGGPVTESPPASAGGTRWTPGPAALHVPRSS